MSSRTSTSPTLTAGTVLVLAKAPVAGRVKTRLGATIGHPLAARVAAASLLDTLEACADAVGTTRCRLALDGDLAAAVHGDELGAALAEWTVVPQQHGSLGQRIAAACRTVDGPVVQIGMDTPQVTPALLRAALVMLDEHPAVLGPADDGGWWLLGLRDPRSASAIADVPMSRPDTGALTRDALVATGLTVATAPRLRDVDELTDLRAVVRDAPGSRVAGVAAEVLA